MGDSNNSPARNTYDTAYWFRTPDVMMRDYREGRRQAVVLPAGWWQHAREDLCRPPRVGDWTFMMEVHGEVYFPYEVVQVERVRLNTMIMSPDCREWLGYAKNYSGVEAYLTWWNTRFPDLPSDEDPMVYFLFLSGLTDGVAGPPEEDKEEETNGVSEERERIAVELEKCLDLYGADLCPIDTDGAKMLLTSVANRIRHGRHLEDPAAQVESVLRAGEILPRADTWTRKFVQWLNEQPDSWVEENAGQMVAFHSPEDVHVGMEAMTKAIDGKQELHYLIASVPSRGKHL